MRKKIVIVGESPLSLFIAQALDRWVARQVEYQVVWVKRDQTLTAPSQFKSLTFPPKGIIAASSLDHVQLANSAVVGVNLAAEHIVLPKQVIGYDLLIVDQTPVYCSTELGQMATAVGSLFSAIQAARNLRQPKTATVAVSGQSVLSYQLALAILHDRRRFKIDPRSLVVQVERPADKALNSYLATQGCVMKSTLAGELGATLRLAPAKPPLAKAKVRGLPTDKNGEGRVTRQLNLRSHDNVWWFGETTRSWQNLGRFDHRLAAQVDAVIRGSIELTDAPKAIEAAAPAFLLTGPTGMYLEHEPLANRFATQHAVRLLEQRFWQSKK